MAKGVGEAFHNSLLSHVVLLSKKTFTEIFRTDCSGGGLDTGFSYNCRKNFSPHGMKMLNSSQKWRDQWSDHKKILRESNFSGKFVVLNNDCVYKTGDFLHVYNFLLQLAWNRFQSNFWLMLNDQSKMKSLKSKRNSRVK